MHNANVANAPLIYHNFHQRKLNRNRVARGLLAKSRRIDARKNARKPFLAILHPWNISLSLEWMESFAFYADHENIFFQPKRGFASFRTDYKLLRTVL